MSFQDTLHQQHIERLQRFMPKAPPKEVVAPVPLLSEPPAAPVKLSYNDARKQDPAPPPPTFPKMRDIQVLVAGVYGVTMADMLSLRKLKTIVKARMVAMYLCRTLTPHSLPEIGRRFGGRDHTTVLYAFDKIRALIAENPEQAEWIDRLKDQLRV